MIQSKKEYLEYLTEDKNSLGIKTNWKTPIKELIAPNYIWKFQKKLRKLEYYKNSRTDFLGKLYGSFLKIRFRKYSLRMGFSIPINVFGPGLAIVHYGTIVINDKAKIGKNCRIHANTNIGASGGSKKAPQIGNNVYIGPGAKIFGDITIGNNIAIAANSSVNKSFNEDGIMLAGSPAKRIKEIDIKNIIPNSNI
ncbi:serine O-acetyltransferase [Arcticibacterium luteifluviistationis]|uniref:Serine acetyltransferase n=1 Tax=Arcticibacterium luteifluviistationis TaxID=1784714 RepID=A0A2Z4GAS9_9BACT|nr:serine acetyltransferase [Arcticibacterium luteifluviistationis]AWV98043.1 serine acetyltransferase [Arcticibacterium luteifluviistationis]